MSSPRKTRRGPPKRPPPKLPFDFDEVSQISNWGDESPEVSSPKGAPALSPRRRARTPQRREARTPSPPSSTAQTKEIDPEFEKQVAKVIELYKKLHAKHRIKDPLPRALRQQQCLEEVEELLRYDPLGKSVLPGHFKNLLVEIKDKFQESGSTKKRKRIKKRKRSKGKRRRRSTRRRRRAN